jgi:dolichol-phosphate mannosyltransferase
MYKLSVIVPAKNESANLPSCIGGIVEVLKKNQIKHEVLVIDDGSTDNTQEILKEIISEQHSVRCVKNQGQSGFGNSVRLGLQKFTGDAVAIMMADRSDSPKDLVRYWNLLLESDTECAFGSRFMAGGYTYNYPKIKLIINRIVNTLIRIVFNIKYNDVTNAFKMYRREVIEGCKPFISPHFNLTVEIPLKAVIRGYSWKVLPISWKNRTHGVAKLKLREMGSRYFFIVAYLWLEKYFSRGDYLKK